MSARRSRKRKAEEPDVGGDGDVFMGEAECQAPVQKRLKVELRAQRAPRVIDTTPEGQEQLRRYVHLHGLLLAALCSDSYLLGIPLAECLTCVE